jgi:hypothetical protein
MLLKTNGLTEVAGNKCSIVARNPQDFSLGEISSMCSGYETLLNLEKCSEKAGKIQSCTFCNYRGNSRKALRD